MSSRALRKAQREREEQQQLEKLQQQEEEEEEEEDDEPVAAPAKKSIFAMLGQEDEDDDDEDEAQEPEDEGGVAIEEEPIQAAPSKAPSKKKKKKKAKGKSGGATPGTPAKDATGKNEEPLDEIDAALKQLSTSGNAAGQTAAGTNQAVTESSKLLAIDTHHLHAQNEMRRLFGRAALDQGGDDEGQVAPGNVGGNRRQQRRVQQVGLAQALRGQRGQGGRAGGLGSLSLRRNIFIQGKEEWPIATGGGLGMEVVSKNADGTVEYRYVHNRAYQDVQSQFESCVASMDPNRLVVLLQHNPYHISTLLQVSEIAKQERDHATAGDLLERALFSLGRAVHSTFAKNLAEGKARLDFSRPENREFWLASWRYMQNLSMRATWRTVYEWAKLLLSLAPEEDPYAIWLVLDQYAIRSQQSLDYLNISRNATFKTVHNSLPNVQLSQGLAEYRAGNKSKGQQALFTAIGRFPWVVARLMQELSIDPPPAIWGKSPRTDREKFHAELYATRAKDLWNTPEICEFLVEIASAIPPEVQSAAPDTSEITPNEARQILLSELPPLIALIPREYTAQLTSTSDPLPPVNNNVSYEVSAQPQHSGAMHRSAAASSAADNFRELQGLYGFFANLFPWFSPTGANADGATEAQPSEEEIERRIQASGVSEETIMHRTQRMMELQANLLGEEDDLGRGAAGGDDDDLPVPQPQHQTPDGAAQAARVAEAERQRRAHVEDAGDE